MVSADVYLINAKLFLLAELKMLRLWLHPCYCFIIFVLLRSDVCALGRKWHIRWQCEHHTGWGESAQWPIPHDRVCQELLQRSTGRPKVSCQICAKIYLRFKAPNTGCIPALFQGSENQKRERVSGPCWFGQILQGKTWSGASMSVFYCCLISCFTSPVSHPGVSDWLLRQRDEQNGCWHLFRWDESREGRSGGRYW